MTTNKSQENQPPSLPPLAVANLSFAACGFMGVYHVGVAAAYRQLAPGVLENSFSGASSGILVAIALLFNWPLGEWTARLSVQRGGTTLP